MNKKANWLFLGLLLFYVGSSFLISYYLYIAEYQEPMWLSLVLSQTLVLTPVLLFIMLNKIKVSKALPYRSLSPVNSLLAILFGYTMVPAVLLLNYISMLFSTNEMNRVTNEITAYPFLLQIFFMAVIPACIEEFVFRGIFYHSYRKSGILGAALLSGVLFGMLHLNINQFIYAFCIGIVFALLVEATGSMFSSMLAHFAINTYSIIVLKLVPDNLTENVNAEEILNTAGPLVHVTTIVILGIFAAGFGTLTYFLYKKLAQRAGRWDHVRTELKKGIRLPGAERFITIPLVIAMIFAAGMMIYLEY